MSPFQLRLAGLSMVVLLALAPTLLSAFSITLMNFIGIYAIAVLGLALFAGAVIYAGLFIKRHFDRLDGMRH